jgi:hypothetical protein
MIGLAGRAALPCCEQCKTISLSSSMCGFGLAGPSARAESLKLSRQLVVEPFHVQKAALADLRQTGCPIESKRLDDFSMQGEESSFCKQVK